MIVVTNGKFDFAHLELEVVVALVELNSAITHLQRQGVIAPAELDDALALLDVQGLVAHRDLFAAVAFLDGQRLVALGDGLGAVLRDLDVCRTIICFIIHLFVQKINLPGFSE